MRPEFRRKSARGTTFGGVTAGLKTLSTLQAYRALAALLVLLYHARNTCAFMGLGDYRALSFFGTAGVYFFFALSGFILFRVHEKDFGHRERVRRFFRKRILRILPLY
jgi:exopolysaccharide production protein ExoZ